MPDEARIRGAIAGAERFLNAWHGAPPIREALLQLADATGADERPDRYGSGERIEGLEQSVAELLGQEAAVFMPSGTMAQQIALRLWSEQKRNATVAFHPTCHLELHEEKGYERLHGLHARLVGDPNRLITLADLEAIREPLAALLLELPQREIGGLLPDWDDLVAQAGWAREHDVALHLDGARLWEAGPFYGREYAEIAGLFGSVYVSFYKGLGGLAVVTGYERALADGVDVACVMAGDNQMDAGDLELLAGTVARGEVDYAKANRLVTGEAWRVIPRNRYLGNAVLSLLTKIASGYWHVAVAVRLHGDRARHARAT